MDIIQLNGLIDECRVKFKVDKKTNSGEVVAFIPYMSDDSDDIGLMVTIDTVYNDSIIPNDIYDKACADMNLPGSMFGTSKVVYYDRYSCDVDKIIITNLDCNITTYYITCYLVLGSSLAYSNPFRNVVNRNEFMSYNITPGQISNIKPTNPIGGDVYFDDKSNQLYAYNDISLLWDKIEYNVQVVKQKPKSPYLNMMIFNTDDASLYIWNGTIWKRVKTVEDGVPMYNKNGIGTIGGNESRKTLTDYIRMMLGYPAVEVELTDQQIGLAITTALHTIRQKSDVAYTRCFVPYQLRSGKQTYFLNDPTNGTDKIVDILTIHMTVWGGLGSMDSYSQQLFVNQFVNPVGVTDLLGMWEWSNLTDDLQKILANEIAYSFDESRRILKIFKNLHADRMVLIESVVERPEQALLTDRNIGIWIQNFALAECKGMLSQIRGKYGDLPGPNGGITMNGAELASQATEEKIALMEQLDDLSCSRLGEWGNVSVFLG